MIVEAIDLCKRFRREDQEIEVFKGLSLSVRKGEMLAISGVSGVGKSTLLHILGTLDRPSSGQVLFGGVDPFRSSDAELAEFRSRKIGFVFQFHHLLPEFTAIENVMMPGLIRGASSREFKANAKEVLKSVGLEERFFHRPGALSGGEQQRAAIARALVMKPEIVLADEPTGNLDGRTSQQVFDLLRNLNQSLGITFVLVTHNEKLSAQADRTVRMVDGKIES